MNNKVGSYYNLSKADINLMKAVGILLILCHNYLHWISTVGENEMNFSIGRIYAYLESIIDRPASLLEDSFTFFGHHGVLLFCFASAYGLSKRMLDKGSEPYFKYLIHRLIKIYALLAFAFIFLYLYEYVHTGEWMFWGKFLKTIKHFLLMEGNFNHSTIFGYVGSWWFFGLIIQFYIIFPLLFYLIKRFKTEEIAVMMLVSYVLIYSLHFLNSKGLSTFPVFGNAVGHLPEFILGISLAIFPNLKINGKMALSALIIYISACFSELVFPLSFLSILIVLLYCLQPLMKVSKDNLLIKFLLFLGQISMFIFVTNGPLRSSTIQYAESIVEGAKGTLIGLSIHFILVLFVSYFMYLIYRFASKLIKKYTGISIM